VTISSEEELSVSHLRLLLLLLLLVHELPTAGGLHLVSSSSCAVVPAGLLTLKVIRFVVLQTASTVPRLIAAGAAEQSARTDGCGSRTAAVVGPRCSRPSSALLPEAVQDLQLVLPGTTASAVLVVQHTKGTLALPLAAPG